MVSREKLKSLFSIIMGMGMVENGFANGKWINFELRLAQF